MEQTEEGDQFYDDKHLILCQTALHAAAASGYDKIVARLLAEEHNALNSLIIPGDLHFTRRFEKITQK